MIETDVTKTRMHKIMNYDKVSAELATLRTENERLRECLQVTDYFLRAMTGPDDAIANAIFDANKEALA